MRIICLTGGLASGKSTATQFLAEQGAYIIDADKAGHRVYEPGARAYREVIATFGDDLIDDDHQIDRKILGSKVFGNQDALEKLTDIVWPEIRRLVEADIAEIRSTDPEGIVVLEAAVLFEAGWQDIGDETWVIVVDREVAIERSMARDGLSREAVENRLQAQLSNEERIAKADIVVENNLDHQALIDQLRAQWQRLDSI
ncbi:MAG: dephospho-CoA kinase [Gammaproteobacteria bacterium]|nr:dephospho-CoA kinase [Gammaproteobacteria bacterium]